MAVHAVGISRIEQVRGEESVVTVCAAEVPMKIRAIPVGVPHHFQLPESTLDGCHHIVGPTHDL
jgi:hypothetical protein